MNLGKAIRQARIDAGYTQEGLARRVHVSRSLIAKYEVGLAVPDQDRIKDLERVLELKEGALSKNKATSFYWFLFVFLSYALAIGLLVMTVFYFLDIYPKFSYGSTCPEPGICYPSCSTVFTSVWKEHLHSLVYFSLPLNVVAVTSLVAIPFFPQGRPWLRLLVLVIGGAALVLGACVFAFDAMSDPNAFNAC